MVGRDGKVCVCVCVCGGGGGGIERQPPRFILRPKLYKLTKLPKTLATLRLDSEHIVWPQIETSKIYLFVYL